MPRRRIHIAEHGRQEAYRQRRLILQDELAAMFEALTAACENGRCEQLTNHLPEETGARVREITRRLNGCKLVVCRREAKSNGTG